MRACVFFWGMTSGTRYFTRYVQVCVMPVRECVFMGATMEGTKTEKKGRQRSKEGERRNRKIEKKRVTDTVRCTPYEM